MIKLNDDQIVRWNEHCLQCFPKEAVACLIENNLYTFENIADDPTKGFKLDPAVFIRYNIDAILHSHCYPLNEPVFRKYDLRTPSYIDYKNQQKSNVPWGISSTEGEGVSEILWFPQSMDEPLLGRRFIFYINDCATLIRDYFWQTFKVDLGYYAVDWEKGIQDNAYLDAIKICNLPFYEVSLSDAKEHDVILMSFDHDNDHAGVFDGVKILHQPDRRISAKHPIGKLGSFITKVFRFDNEQYTSSRTT